MPILYLQRHQASVIVPGHADKSLRSPIKDLAALISEAKHKKLGRHWRVLLADELVYQLTIPLPPHTYDKEAYLSKQLSVEVPDKLEKYDWGYTVGKAADGDQAYIFAPTPAYWRNVRIQLQAQKLSIEAITTETLALGNGKDVFDGATKTCVDKAIVRSLLPSNTRAMTARFAFATIIAIGIIVAVLILVVRGAL